MPDDSYPAIATAVRAAPPPFQREERVEVTSMEPGFVGAWFEGRVVRVGKLKERLTVEYDHLLDHADDSRPLREVVDASSVRPRRPPPVAPEEFCTGDAVEAFTNDGWWVGVIVETLPESVFVVMFLDGNPQRISRENLRKRLDWVRSEWVSPVKKMDVVREITPKIVVREITPKRKHGRPPKNSSKLRDKSSPVEGGKKIEGNFSAEHILQRCEMRQANASDSQSKVKDTPRLDDVREITPKRKRGRPPKNSSKLGDESSPVEGGKKIEGNFSAEHILQRCEVRQANASDSQCKVKDTPRLDDVREITPKRKRGKPPKKSSKWGDESSPVVGGKKIEGNFSAEHILQRCEVRKANASDSQCKVKDTTRLDDVAITETVHSQGSVNRITEEGKDNFVSSSHCSPQAAVKADGEVESTNPTDTSLHASGGEALAEDIANTFSESGGVLDDLELARTEVSLPLTSSSFAKMIPVWELVLSMDIFRRMPQYPHFQPLQQYSKESQEGLALGQLVNFANLVDSIDTVKFDTPTCDLEKKLEVLGGFEQHGFDVQVLRVRLQEWIKAKKNCDKFKQELFEHEIQISEKEKQSSMIDTKIDDIDKKARDLSTERAAFVRTKETCQFELSQLQRNIRVLKEGYADARRDFDNIVVGGNF